MSAKTDRQAIFGTDDESSGDENDHEDTNPADSVKPGRGAPKTDIRVRLTVQQKMEAVKHFHDNKGMTQAALIGWCFHKFQMKTRSYTKVTSQLGWIEINSQGGLMISITR